MAGYWIVRGSGIKDDDALKQYGQLWAPIAQKYGAEVIAGRAAIDTREGVDFPRQLIIRFPSYEDAQACYDDPNTRQQ